MELQDLYDEISMAGFDYARYWEHEESIIKPRLEEKGHTNIRFSMGERDSFGPLTRLVHTDTATFIYG